MSISKLKEVQLNIDSKKYSYEGEGPRFGLKTFFISYSGKQGTELVDLDEVYQKARCLYINTNTLDDDLLLFCTKASQAGIHITIETEIRIEKSNNLYKLKNILFFFSYRSDQKSWVGAYIRPKIDFLKIRILQPSALSACIEMANTYAKQHKIQVLLMPEYLIEDYSQVLLGRFASIHHKVRFMPPVHTVLNIP